MKKSLLIPLLLGFLLSACERATPVPSLPPADEAMIAVISGESIGLGATYMVASPSFALNQP